MTCPTPVFEKFLCKIWERKHFVCLEEVLDCWLKLMRNGSKNKCWLNVKDEEREPKRTFKPCILSLLTWLLVLESYNNFHVIDSASQIWCQEGVGWRTCWIDAVQQPNKHFILSIQKLCRPSKLCTFLSSGYYFYTLQAPLIKWEFFSILIRGKQWVEGVFNHSWANDTAVKLCCNSYLVTRLQGIR